MMNLSTLSFEEFSWAREIIFDYNDLIVTNANEAPISKKLDILITKTVRLIKREILDFFSLSNVNTFVNFLEGFMNNLNEVHTSLKKVLPNFDQSLLPLVAIYADVMGFQARCSESEIMYNQYMKKFENFLISLSVHPTLTITAFQRVETLLPQLTLFITSGSTDNKNESKSTTKEKDESGCEEDVNDAESCDLNCEPTVIPETPLKNSEPTCVGLAAIRGIVPISPASSGCLVSSLTPPPATSDDICVSQIPEKNATKLLIDVGKILRQKFRISHLITPTEKIANRRILRTLRSRRRLKPSPWKVFNTNFPSHTSPIRREQLFVETDNGNHNLSSSQLSLYLSPDSEKDPSPSLPTCDSIKNICEQTKKNILNSPQVVKSPVIVQKSPLLDDNQNKINDASSEKEKNNDIYTELQKSIEGNIMGCEASLSDVELMDEIESSLNFEGDEDDISLQDGPVFVDSMTNVSTTSDFTKVESQILPVSNIKEVSDSLESPATKTSNPPSQERRKSSRLAGIYVLPIKYRTEPLPDCRRQSIKKKRPSSPNESKETLSSPMKKLSSERASDFQEQSQQPSAATARLSWQEVRLLLPSCWADIIDDHVKTHHQDEWIRYQDGERYPTFHCNCAAIKPSQ